MKKVRTLLLVAAALLVAFVGAGLYMTGQSYRLANRVVTPPPYTADSSISDFHDSMFIADMHSDTFTFVDSFMERKDYAHLDYYRAMDGGFNLLTMAIATEVPFSMVRRKPGGVERGGNLIQIGSIGGLEPLPNWYSRYARGTWVADNVARVVAENPEQLMLVTTRQDLQALLDNHERGKSQRIGFLLAIEGAHALDNDLQRLDDFYERGVRILSITHAFDNEYGGSSEGVERYGITAEGERLLDRARELGIIIDIAHASPTLVNDILDRSSAPVVYSHGGITGTCDVDRNLPEPLLNRIRSNGGLIAIGFWTRVLCGDDIADIAATMRYVADRIGVEHLALGSDFDGGVTTITDAAGLPLLTDALFDAGFSDNEIRRIMGGNYAQLLLTALPDN